MLTMFVSRAQCLATTAARDVPDCTPGLDNVASVRDHLWVPLLSLQ